MTPQDPARARTPRRRRPGARHSTSVAAILAVLATTGACASPDIGPASFTRLQPSPSPAAPAPTRWFADAPSPQPSWLRPWLRRTTPQWLCPDDGWQGLTVETEDPDEATYLQSMPACTHKGTRTWLRNSSGIVWVLHNTSPNPPTPHQRGETVKGSSFRAIMAATGRPGVELLPPGEDVVIESPPQSVSWTIDVPATLAWATHDITADEIGSLGVGRIESALQRRGTEGAALAQCTLSGFQVGLTSAQLKGLDIPALTGDDTRALLVDALGSGVHAQKCLAAAQRVHPSTRVLTPLPSLSQRMALDLSSSSTLQKVHTNLSLAQRGVQFLGQAAQVAR